MDKELLRTKAIEDSDVISQKPRFGLFSHPLTTAVGDNGPYQSSLHPRENQGKGKPVTELKNIQSGTYRNGRGKDHHFGTFNSLAGSGIKDQYIEQPKRLLKEDNKAFEKGKIHDSKFNPPSGTGNSILCKAAYQYIEEKPDLPNPKRNRDENGMVKTELQNVCATTKEKIVQRYFKHYKYQSDPFDRAHQMALQKQMRDKQLQPESSFKPNNFKPDLFWKDSSVYQNNPLLPRKEKKSQSKVKIVRNDEPWRPSHPSKQGLYGYFSKFPEYKQNPPTELKRKDGQKKQAFKSMGAIALAKPTPSISTNAVNMRKYVSRSVLRA